MPTLKELPEEIFATLTAKVRFISLASISKDGPVIRSLGSWGAEGSTVYFSTRRTADKVAQLAADNRVSVQLLAESQELPALRNVVVNGVAKSLEGDAQRAPAIAAIGERNPRFKEQASRGELDGNALFAVEAKQITVLDFSKGVGPAALGVYQG